MKLCTWRSWRLFGGRISAVVCSAACLCFQVSASVSCGPQECLWSLLCSVQSIPTSWAWILQEEGAARAQGRCFSSFRARGKQPPDQSCFNRSHRITSVGKDLLDPQSQQNQILSWVELMIFHFAMDWYKVDFQILFMLLRKKIYPVQCTENKFEKNSFLLVPECISLYPVTGTADPKPACFPDF